MENEKTIIVDPGFYQKTVNKNQFVERWVEHVQEVKRIIDYNNLEDLNNCETFKMFVIELAEKHFEKVYKRQNK